MKGVKTTTYKGRIEGTGGLGLERKDFRNIANDLKKNGCFGLGKGTDTDRIGVGENVRKWRIS